MGGCPHVGVPPFSYISPEGVNDSLHPNFPAPYVSLELDASDHAALQGKEHVEGHKKGTTRQTARKGVRLHAPTSREI
jgi:hypothetical protein